MQEDRRTPFALIVEDHPLVADSLVACVRHCEAGLAVVVAESLHAALRVLAVRPPPVLIVTDLTLTDAQGTEAVRHLREAAPQSPLLVFTALDDPALRSAAVAAGAMDCLVKSASIQALHDAIHSVIGGQPAESHAASARSRRPKRLLTPEQLAVLEELAVGRSNKEIAARMKLSGETVSSHMKEILSRLGVKNRTEAVIRYLEMIREPDDRPRR